MTTLDRLRKWAKENAKNPNAIVRMYKKLNLIEKELFLGTLGTKEGRDMMKGNK